MGDLKRGGRRCRDIFFSAWRCDGTEVHGSFTVDQKSPSTATHGTGESSGIRSVKEQEISFSDAITFTSLPAPRPFDQAEFAACLRTANAIVDGKSDLERRLGCSGIRHYAGNVRNSSKEDDGCVACETGFHGFDLLHGRARSRTARKTSRTGRNLRHCQ